MKVSAPHADDCQLCDLPLGDEPVSRVRRGWVHQACWLKEHE